MQSVQGEAVPALAFRPQAAYRATAAFSIADLELGVVAHVQCRAGRTIAPMFNWRARYVAEPHLDAANCRWWRSTLPTGSAMRSDDAEIDKAHQRPPRPSPAALVRNNGGRIPMLFDSSPATC